MQRFWVVMLGVLLAGCPLVVGTGDYACDSAADCTGGQACVAKVCRTPCSVENICPAGQECGAAGACLPVQGGASSSGVVATSSISQGQPSSSATSLGTSSAGSLASSGMGGGSSTSGTTSSASSPASRPSSGVLPDSSGSSATSLATSSATSAMTASSASSAGQPPSSLHAGSSSSTGASSGMGCVDALCPRAEDSCHVGQCSKFGECEIASLPEGAPCGSLSLCSGEGTCEPACSINNQLVPTNTLAPDNTCKLCLPSLNQFGWSAAMDQTPCGTNDGRYCGTHSACFSGSCVASEVTCPLGQFCSDAAMGCVDCLTASDCVPTGCQQNPQCLSGTCAYAPVCTDPKLPVCVDEGNLLGSCHCVDMSCGVGMMCDSNANCVRGSGNGGGG